MAPVGSAVGGSDGKRSGWYFVGTGVGVSVAAVGEFVGLGVKHIGRLVMLELQSVLWL